MNRFRVFALAGVGLLGLSLGTAQAGGWHRHYCRPVCPAPVVTCAPAPVVTCAPAPVVTCAPTPCPAPVVCPPVVYRTSYCAPVYCGWHVHSWRHCH